MPRTTQYLKEIEKLKERTFENLTDKELKKYGENFNTFDREHPEEMNATEKELKRFLEAKNLIDHQESSHTIHPRVQTVI